MDELDFVLRKIKTGKARDAYGMVREIFRRNIIGQDLKLSLLTLLITIKEEGKAMVVGRTVESFYIPRLEVDT